jgi:hypothetical protein
MAANVPRSRPFLYRLSTGSGARVVTVERLKRRLGRRLDG